MTTNESGERPMYDMYPEWGPAKHRSTDAAGHTKLGNHEANRALQTAFDPRDASAERPDDN